MKNRLRQKNLKSHCRLWRQRGIAALLLLALLCCSCSALYENNNLEDLPSLSPSHDDFGEPYRVIRPALYFLSVRTAKLAAEVRELTVAQDQTAEEVIVSAMLEGPASEELLPFGMDLTLERVEVMDEIANVYIASQYGMTEEYEFTLAVAVADTLIGYSGVSYVAVFINGEVLNIEGKPCGLLRKSDGAVQELYQEYQAKYSPVYHSAQSDEHELEVALYFLDATGTYLVPEVRTIAFENHLSTTQSVQHFVQKLLEELALGPKNKYYLKTYLDRERLSEQNMQVKLLDDYDVLRLKTQELPWMQGVQAGAGVSALYYTLAGVLPAFSKLLVLSGENVLLTGQSAAQAHAADVIQICLPTEDYRALRAITRTVNVQSAARLSTYLEELLRGPIQEDEDSVTACFPEGAVESDILSVALLGDIAYVDFSERLMDLIRQMPEDAQTMLFYAIINTLCRTGLVKAVQFLCNGEFVQSVGRVNLFHPLMPNNGLLK